ncbi:MAG: hypothetical protein ACI4E1_13490 [Lachnospira sp.]
MKRFRNVPTIITLLAGFIASVIMILHKYSLMDFLWILILTMVCFFVAALVVCILINKLFDYTDKKQEEIMAAKKAEEEAARAEEEAVSKEEEKKK